MQSFDLTTADSFLPIMDNTENVTKQLISSILMYNSLLDAKSKPILINFVLTTRISDNAKLRLAKQYKSVEQLVDDMNKHLLTKKSFTSLQEQLLGCTQNQKTIDDYGQEIENLFVELTIAQADGDPNKRKVLQPLNEKTAINRFATGLKNKNLSVIIAARTYTTLKEAIRDAKDEQAALSARAPKSSDPKPFFNINSAGPTWARGRGGQHSHRGHGAPSQRGHGAPSQRGHSHVGRGGYSQPNQRGNVHAGRGSHTHPSQHGHGQSSRGNFHGTNHNQGGHNNKFNNHGEGNKSNTQDKVKVVTHVHVTTTTTTDSVKSAGCTKNTTPHKPSGNPKNNYPPKTTVNTKNNNPSNANPKNNKK